MLCFAAHPATPFLYQVHMDTPWTPVLLKALQVFVSPTHTVTVTATLFSRRENASKDSGFQSRVSPVVRGFPGCPVLQGTTLLLLLHCEQWLCRSDVTSRAPTSKGHAQKGSPQSWDPDVASPRDGVGPAEKSSNSPLGTVEAREAISAADSQAASRPLRARTWKPAEASTVSVHGHQVCRGFCAASGPNPGPSSMCHVL